MAPKGIGLSYENISDDFKKKPDLLDDSFKKAKASMEMDLKLRNIDSKLKSQLDNDLEDADAEKAEEEKKVISSTAFQMEQLKSNIVDLNNDNSVGTDLRNSERYSTLRDKQEDINQYQKDVKSEIAKLARPSVNELSKENANLLISFIDKGVLSGMKFKKGLRDMYIEAKFPTYKNASKEEKRDMRDKADHWADSMKDVLQAHDLWDDAKVVNRFEKKEDRVEKRAQRKTEYNEAETIFTEGQLKNMLDTAAMMMGRDTFANALYEKIKDLRPNNKLPKWSNMKELNGVLGNATHLDYIRGVLKANLSFMTVSNVQEWLNSGEYQGDLLDTYKTEIEKQHAKEIDVVLQELYPNITQAQMRKKRAEVTAQIAAGVMSVTNEETGMELKGAGVGGSITFGGLDRVQPIISRISIGVGVSNGGVPGFAVDFGKDFKRKTGGVHLDAGAANFVIPFARVGIDQSLFNNKALQENLRKKRVFKVGAYAEAAPGYAGVGINVGNNLMEGIDRQQENIERSFVNLIKNIDEDTPLETAKLVLKSQFQKANDAMLTNAAQHILDGLKQGYTAEDIAATYAAAWKNEAIKDTRGKVDVNVEAGIGTLMSIPVLKAFVGLKIYKRSTMLTDKYDRDAKENKLSTFNGYQKFDNADTKDMSNAEKIAYWLGNKATVSETAKTISIASTDNNTPIYDTFDIYVKDKKLVKVTADEITLSKRSNVLMGKLISSYGEKQKIYIGYDKQTDIDAAKFPLNGTINGKPELVPEQIGETIIEEKTFSMDVKERLNIYAEYFENAKFKAIEATSQVQAKKYKYNELCGDLINHTHLLFDKEKSVQARKDTLSTFNTIMTSIGAEKLTVKENDPKNEIVNQMLNTIGYSAKARNLNIDNPNHNQQKNFPKDISSLINRKGAIAAFTSGLRGTEEIEKRPIQQDEFNALYKTVEGINLYKQISYPNAIAVVAYYRNIRPNTAINDLAITGFDAVKLAGNPNNGNVFKDLNVSKEMSELIIRPVWNNEKEFEIYKARINTMLSTAKVDASLFTEEDYKDLLRGKKVHGVILNKEIFKAFNGPCVNEAFVLNLLGIHIDKRIVKTPKAADIYVGIEHTDNYQKSHSINIGVGAAYGNKPKPKKTTPPSPPENPKEPDGTTTIEDSGSAADNGVLVNGTNGRGDGGDDGEGGGDK